jgi:DNA-directed RNA polymerase specialized sigma24 family protein
MLAFSGPFGMMPVVADIVFEQLVRAHYAPLLRFALSLARDEVTAADLVQQTFYL